MSSPKSVGQPEYFESINDYATRKLALGERSECAKTRGAPTQGNEKLLDKRGWAWSARNEYDWMDEHGPFNESN
jgi:hypothetical protein